MSFFTTDDLSGAVTSIGTKLNEKAAVVQLYPLFKKATSSSSEPTPGYIYEILVEFTFESKKNSVMLVDYLNKRLQRHSAHGVNKTLKCFRHLVDRGSREFRKELRQHDEHIKNAPNFGSQKNSFTGTALLAETRSLANSLLTSLFDQSSIEQDSCQVPEQPPARLPQTLAGMGSGGGGSSGGKYDGFGNSPVDRGVSGVTEKVRDMLDSVLQVPDPRHHLLEYCLKDSRGEYEPVPVDIGSFPGGPLPATATASRQLHRPPPPRQHVPGKAGGGWDSSDDDNAAGTDIANIHDVASDDDMEEMPDFGGLALDVEPATAATPSVALTASGGSSSSSSSGGSCSTDQLEATQHMQLIRSFCCRPADHESSPAKSSQKTAATSPPTVSAAEYSRLQAVADQLAGVSGSQSGLTTLLYCLQRVLGELLPVTGGKEVAEDEEEEKKHRRMLNLFLTLLLAESLLVERGVAVGEKGAGLVLRLLGEPLARCRELAGRGGIREKAGKLVAVVEFHRES